jgi:hypothetical protein
MGNKSDPRENLFVIFRRTNTHLEEVEFRPLRLITRDLVVRNRFTFDEIAQASKIGSAFGLTGGQRLARAWDLS